MTQRTVVSVDGSEYQEWQAQLLATTYQAVGQPGPLTRLWASTEPPTPWPWDTFVTPNYADYSPVRQYTPLNRVVGLRDWYSAGQVDDDDTVLVIDPDVVFCDRIDVDIAHGAIAGHNWPFLTDHREPGFVARQCTVADDQVPTIGYPYACRGRELGVLAEMLPERIIAVQRENRDDWWVDEMWAFIFCVAELGWEVTYPTWVSDVCDVDTGWPRPLLHYAFGVHKGWEWTKFDWRPGQPIAECTDEAVPAAHVFARTLRSWAATQATTAP